MLLILCSPDTAEERMSELENPWTPKGKEHKSLKKQNRISKHSRTTTKDSCSHIIGNNRRRKETEKRRNI